MQIYDKQKGNFWGIDEEDDNDDENTENDDNDDVGVDSYDRNDEDRNRESFGNGDGNEAVPPRPFDKQKQQQRQHNHHHKQQQQQLQRQRWRHDPEHQRRGNNERLGQRPHYGPATSGYQPLVVTTPFDVLRRALDINDRSTMRRLLTSGLHPDADFYDAALGVTLLMRAAIDPNKFEIVQMLLAHGADPNRVADRTG